MARFFGTNGIRGVFGSGLTLGLAHDMALAFGTWLGGGPVLVGRDGRHSSLAVSRAVCAALNSAGIHCGDAQLVPTPCLEYAVKSLGYAGGVMVTASHNPPEYNGIKPVAGDGIEVSREAELDIEAIYEKGARPRPPGWGKTTDEGRATGAYADGVLSRIDGAAVRAKKFKVVLDMGNGAQAACAPAIAESLGCDIVLVNAEVDGDFAGRGPEPTPENLSALSGAIKEHGADLGIAFDGDGDRSMFCDDSGAVLTGDRSALVLARHILAKRPGSTVVTCLNSGSAIEPLAAESGSAVRRTRVGSVEVSREMARVGALVGFEENGGFMYGPHNPVRDGCMALALMLELLAESGASLSGHAEQLGPSFTAKAKVGCRPQDVPGVLAALKSEHPDADTTDGVRVQLGPRTWVMVRPSGTEPIIRVYAEAESQAGLDSLVSLYLGKVKSALAK